MTAGEYDTTVDVLVVGSGGGGMTAALTADAAGLDTLVVEKSAHFGGSTALSGGGIWVPGAPSQRKSGYVPDPDGVFQYLQKITEGLVSDARLRQYVDCAPAMMEFLEERSRWLEFVWKPGYADYYPELPGGSELGSTINVPAIDLRRLGDEEQNLLRPLALAPKGIWFAPKDLRLFYQVRQNWRGKAVLLKLIWRMVRARVFGDRMAAIGQSLAARLRLAMTEHDVPLWLDSPMTELITDVDGAVVGAVVEHDGKQHRIGARGGVILAAGGFDHDMEWRRQHLPVLEKDWSFGNPASMGDGIRAGEKVGGSTDLLDEAWWFPAMCWPDGRLQFMLNERMMPAQFVVNGDGERFINEAAPYMDFAHAMIRGQESGVTHIPCWLITDIRSFHRYVVGGHLPDSEGAVCAGADRSEGAQGVARFGRRQGSQQLRAARRANRRATRPTSRNRGPLQRVGAQRSRRRLQPRRFGATTTTTATPRCRTPTCIRWVSRRTTRSRSSSATSAPRAACGPTSSPACCAPTTAP